VASADEEGEEPVDYPLLLALLHLGQALAQHRIFACKFPLFNRQVLDLAGLFFNDGKCELQVEMLAFQFQLACDQLGPTGDFLAWPSFLDREGAELDKFLDVGPSDLIFLSMACFEEVGWQFDPLALWPCNAGEDVADHAASIHTQIGIRQGFVPGTAI